jgi:putative addiction module CopG family antidote
MIELTPQQQQFVDEQIAAGLFSEPSAVVGAALGLLEQRQREYSRLQSAIAQVERGEYAPLDIEEVKRRGHERKAIH